MAKPETEESERGYAQEHRDTKDVPYYIPDLTGKINPEIRKILERYSGIPAKDVVKHVHDIRDKAWSIRSYPCTGLGVFLRPMCKVLSDYDLILQTLKDGGSLLDIGCFLGQDLRALVFDGAPSNHLCGIDIISHWDIGYEMYQDRGRFQTKFIETDLLNPKPELSAMRFDIITIFQVLHQWDLDPQLKALKQMIALSESKGRIVGMQIGTTIQNHQPPQRSGFDKLYWHDPETFQELWKKAGDETGTSWGLTSKFREWDELGVSMDEVVILGPGAKMLEWSAQIQ